MKNFVKNLNKSPILLSIAIALLAVILSPSVFANASLKDIRIGQSSDNTRVVFEVKEHSGVKISRMVNPPRIVVDFYNTNNEISFKQKRFLDSRLGKIRMQDYKQRTRVVLDLRKDFDHTFFTLAKNNKGVGRVVIDLSNKIIAKAKPAKNKPKQVNKKIGITRKQTSPPIPLFDLSNHQDLIIAIDAGHGGKDPGAIGPGNVQEKVVVLAMAKRLKKYIDAQPGMRAILTRDRDIFIPLSQRVRIANQHNADIFLSIHADAFYDRSARGGSVYMLSTKGASSVMARILARSNNSSVSGVDLGAQNSDVAFILSDLSREANLRASRKLGNAVLSAMGQSVRLHKDSVQSANFAVLKSIDMPSILIEAAFVSNPIEEKKLNTSSFQSTIAKSITRGLTKFAKANGQKPRWGENLYVQYKVQRGDTLSQIASRHKTSTKILKEINGIKQANSLHVGKKLKIPVAQEVVAYL